MKFVAVIEVGFDTFRRTFDTEGSAKLWVAFQALQAEDAGIRVGRLFVFGIRKEN